ncbi:hypothetical protein [Actinobaculum sp. 313]|uniref:hypothetical protein n=1 Tax=Actinobaculum sp. 313 TaxID=2495645 RepID=UPI000F73CB3D|nr:hypothetical protein [Actinobaculum sp. 313]
MAVRRGGALNRAAADGVIPQRSSFGGEPVTALISRLSGRSAVLREYPGALAKTRRIGLCGGCGVVSVLGGYPETLPGRGAVHEHMASMETPRGNLNTVI